MALDQKAALDSSDKAERQLLEVARTALLRRDPAEALKALAAHRSRFTAGSFSEESDGLEVQALTMSGQVDLARSRGAAFLVKYPNSVFGPAVEAAVEAAKEE